MNEHAPDLDMADPSFTHTGLHKDSAEQDNDTNRVVNSSNTQMAPQAPPKTFTDLPRELRDRIYSLCFSFSDKTPLVVLARPGSRPQDHEGPQNPDMTAQMASKHLCLYPASYATFGDCKVTDPLDATLTRSTVDDSASDLYWEKSLTGILYANKQISSEAAPYLYQSHTFFFEDLALSKKFLENVGQKNLENVHKISIYYPEELELVESPTEAIKEPNELAANSLAFSKVISMKWELKHLCVQIAKSMPRIKELTVWIGNILELEYEGCRSPAYETALLQLADLKEVEDLVVRKHGEAIDNSGDEDARWYENQWDYTIRGVKEMIATGYHAALDRMRKAFVKDH